MAMIEVDGKKYVVLSDYYRGRFFGMIQGIALGVSIGLCIAWVLGWW